MCIFFVDVGAFWLWITGTSLHAFDGAEFPMDFLIRIVRLANSMLEILHLRTVRERWTFALN